MTMTTVYQWPTFRLEFDPAAGTVITRFPDGTWSGGGVVREDAHHAHRLGLSPLEHRLHHELAHHLAQRALGATIEGACRIVRRDALRAPQVQPEAATDEWRITALQYFAAGAPQRAHGDYGALLDFQAAGTDPIALARRLCWLMDAALHVTHVTL